jgi:hypothetical protein
MPTAHELSQMIFVMSYGYPKSIRILRALVASLPTRNSAAYPAFAADEHTVGMIQLMWSIAPLMDPSVLIPKYKMPPALDLALCSLW